jgi:ribonuclease HI
VRKLRPHPGAGLKTIRIYTDGAARGNPGHAGIGVVIEDDKGMRLNGKVKYIGTATNNEAEYHALIEGLKAVSEWKPDRLEIYLDSKLVAEQMKDKYRVKEPRLQTLHSKAKEILSGFQEFEINHVERERNKGADALANRAIDEYLNKSKPPG